MIDIDFKFVGPTANFTNVFLLIFDESNIKGTKKALNVLLKEGGLIFFF